MSVLKVKNNGVWEAVGSTVVVGGNTSSSGGSGSGSQVQADYAQNDSSAMDYIKNRPCYVEENKTIFDQTITTQPSDDIPLNNYMPDQPIFNTNTERIDKTILVTVDDVEYQCKEFTTNSMGNGYGNKIILLEGFSNATGMTIEEVINMMPEWAEFNEDTNEPFLFGCDDNGLTIYTRQAGTYHYKIQTDLYHMLDANLMPEVDALPQVTTDNNGQTLAVVNGEWAVTAAASGLPTVTTADNDKVLMVVDGAWVAGSIANGDEVYY